MGEIINKNKKLILFDLDGVILNSKDNMFTSWLAVQDEFNITVPFDSYFQNIGRPFSEIMKILGLTDKARDIEDVYKKASMSNLDKLTFYDGVDVALLKLAKLGYKLGVVTSKDEERTKLILSMLDVTFCVIQTPNEKYRGKPCPDHILIALAETNTDPDEAVYIGDMEVDYIAASRAGIDYFHAVWGYFGDLESNVAKFESLTEIVTHLEGVHP